MKPHSERSGWSPKRRAVLCSSLALAAVFLPHLPFLRLPYFWDEAGQFIPDAVDILLHGAWVPISVTPNIHPPAVMAYLALAWKLAGYHVAVTRAAMLLLASAGLLAAFLVARELSKGAALFAAFLLAISPMFFGQAMLAQLDAPAMLFTMLALLAFLRERIRIAAALCVALVLVKETGLVVPLVFAGWLAYERRWRDAAWFLAPAAVLAIWIAALFRATGQWAGSTGFEQYNVEYPLEPARVGVAFARRVYTLFVANFHWVGTAAMLAGWRLFRDRRWRIAWLLVAAHAVMLSLLGGAVLERYLLPVMPIVYAAMATAVLSFRRWLRAASAAALATGIAAGLLINPPYPFPYENNLAFTDFITLQQQTTSYLESRYADASVATVWPLTAELLHPELGFVERKVPVVRLKNLSAQTLRAMNWNQLQVLVVYSRNWDPRSSLLHYGPILRFWQRVYGYVPNLGMAEARAMSPYPVAAHFERRGQWVDIYVNPKTSLGASLR